MDSPESRGLFSAPPWLFTRQGLVVLAVVALIALAMAAIDVAILSTCLLIVGLVGWAWSRGALARVTCTRGTRKARAFCGEDIVVETRVTNARPLPLPWAEVWEMYPRALEPDGEREPSYAARGTVWVCQGLALWPYQRATWRRRLTCQRRGAYRLEPPRIRAGDPFGLLEKEAAPAESLEVLVYPRVVPLRRLGLPLHHSSLDAVTARSSATDPTRTAALRDYRPDDPLRLIHWPSTARRGDLQVRVLEPSTSLRVTLVLDVRGFPHGFYRETLLEVAISAIASMAIYLHGQGHPTSVLVNTAAPLVLPAGTSVQHLEGILDALARLEPTAGVPLSPWVLSHLQRGSTVLLVGSDLAPDREATLRQVERAGFRVLPMLACTKRPNVETWHGKVVPLLPGWDLAAILEGRT
jgi:uncharacterized protein (DUF58 family)